jgi:exopolysaccharide biosynthesis WecB/TagA/CpsF family protein
MDVTTPIHWPKKKDIFGSQISATSYDEVEELVIQAARSHASAVVTLLPVHGIVTAAWDASYRRKVNSFDLAAPDGQPVRWALNRFHGAGLRDRVYGPELMLRLCRRCAREDISIYLYGSTPDVLDALGTRLTPLCPGLRIAGSESPPFRPLTPDEDAAVIQRINDSGAGLVFIGLGLPKQDHFAYDHRGKIHGVQICVGAAFDFHAGTKKMAPSWMQHGGLEWLYRLIQEPRRLWRRYLTTNAAFMALVGRRLLLGR